jgi:AAA+ ATPase superfamily predicted ATPase
MESGEKLFVYSERRFGKTSLVRLALDRLPKKQVVSAYIDLWPTDGAFSFAAVTAKALAESMSTRAERMLETAKAFFGRLSPSITVNNEGRPEITFGTKGFGEPGPELDEVLEAPQRIAVQGGRRVVVVFDEFQRILEYAGDKVERQLRSIIQTQADVSYVFLGSRRHLIQKMFLDRSRPLYRSGGHYPLGPIKEGDWLPFIRKRFLEGNKRIHDEQIRLICTLTEGHPFYTQHLCHVLWDTCEEKGEITGELIESAVRTLLAHESYAYTTLWESFPVNQRRFLTGLASEPPGIRVFASDFIQRYGLRSASNAQRAIESLLERDIIDRDNGSFIISDRFFKIWIQKTQGASGGPDVLQSSLGQKA